MKKTYRALVKLLIAHESRTVEAGEVFEAEFPEGMKLAPNIELVDAETAEPAKGAKKAKAADSAA